MSEGYYPVIPVIGPPEVLERKGSRTKFWIRLPSSTTPWLLKFPRPMTGEHWAEKIAMEIGGLIGVSCARIELARFEGQAVMLGQDTEQWQRNLGRIGTIAESFLPTERGEYSYTMEHHIYHGADVLQSFIEGYDTKLRFDQRDHNVKNIVSTMALLMGVGSMNPMPFWDEEFKKLASFALLDGLIGNTDRHHENWMVDFLDDQGSLSLHILPSFDHASSLGRELLDEKRAAILEKNDMVNYLYRGKGGVFINSTEGKRSPLKLARLLCRWAPDFVSDVRDKIADLTDAEIWGTINDVPSELMSEVAKVFAFTLITTSRGEILRSAS